MSGASSLLVRVSGRLCALALADVIEVMRPLPIRPLAGLPAFVLGAALVRGVATPVIDLATLAGEAAEAAPGRFVTVRAGDRPIALHVAEVLGVREVPSSAALPGLFEGAADRLSALGALDGELLAVLATARLMPPDGWAALDAEEPA